jgi:hypothetical protein
MFVLVSPGPSPADQRTSDRAPQIRIVEVQKADGQILSYRHLAGSTEVEMRGTELAPGARIKLKIGSRPGFVELDINRGGITGLAPAQRLGKDFLTYVLWAVSVDGKASNLGEITFEGGLPVAVNLTTPYQTFWLMVTAEPNYAVVDPSSHVMLYSVKQGGASENGALAIQGDLFYFTHYSNYESTPGDPPSQIPNQLLQARKAVELASKSGVLASDRSGSALKEQQYTRIALGQANSFLARAEEAFAKNPKDQQVIQFARTAAQSAENARALAMGAVGGVLVRQLENDVARLRGEIERLKAQPAEGPVPVNPVEMVVRPPEPLPAPPELGTVATGSAPASALPTLVKQPALWFAVAGWALALLLLFRRRSI